MLTDSPLLPQALPLDASQSLLPAAASEAVEREESTHPGRERTDRFEFLDVLRGLAIWAVLLLHCTYDVTQTRSPALDAVVGILHHGYLGVQLFFVISGYCITAAVYRSAAKPGAVGHFFSRRFRRILPPYWASMVLTVSLGLLTVALLKRPFLSVFPMTARDWLLNICLLQQPFGAPDANMVYWSLSIELQFYLVMGLGLLCRSGVEAYLLLVSITFAWMLTTSGWNSNGMIVAYWHEFACGIAAYYFITRTNRWAGTPWLLLATALGVGYMDLAAADSLFRPDGRFILAGKVAFCLGVLVLLVISHPWDRNLSERCVSRWLAFFGTISYSLYLTHVPVVTRIYNGGQRLTGLDGWFFGAYTLMALAAAVAASYWFFKWCEEPWMTRPSRQVTGDVSQRTMCAPIS
jgi:peptidoglycan/LPS O-acetylase OafA/YrhL